MSEENIAIATTAPMQMAPNLTPLDVANQVRLVQEVMTAVMQDKTHYGTIPGCGDKPTLLQPGAQVLNLTFQMAPKFSIEKEELALGHREYVVTCDLYSKVTGQLVGSGVGSCSTMESKYRYRNVADFEDTGEPIPADSKERKAEYRKQGFGMKKLADGTWAWVQYKDSQKSENPDIADTYNTVLKMATKRALVHATLNTTAASDMFTQDVEDLPREDAPEHTATTPAPAPVIHHHDYARLTELKAIFAEAMGWEVGDAAKSIVRDHGDPRGMDDAQYAAMLRRLETQMTESGMLDKPAPEKPSVEAPPANPSLYEEVPF